MGGNSSGSLTLPPGRSWRGEELSRVLLEDAPHEPVSKARLAKQTQPVADGVGETEAEIGAPEEPLRRNAPPELAEGREVRTAER